MPLDVAAKAAAKLGGTAGSILDAKGRIVHGIGPHESVYAAVTKLKEHQIGALFVVQGADVIGVISERDYARKIILEGRASKTTTVAQIMSAPVICVETTTSLGRCMQLMNERRIRHLGVLEGGRLVGVVSIGDIVRAIILQQEQTIEQLSTLITDPYPA